MKLFLGIAIAVLCLVQTARGDIRIATFNVALHRDGPGLLLRDLLERDDAQINALVRIIQQVQPDILLLNEFDHDLNGIALFQFAEKLRQGPLGISFDHQYAPPQNSGVLAEADLDGDGATSLPGDAFGFGNFTGQYAMAVLSRFPIDTENARDFSNLLWKNLPDAQLPRRRDGSAFPSQKAQQVMRLSSKSHWDVPIILPDGRFFHLLASHPTPPVFDGPEDRNGLRNDDEIRFWDLYLNGTFFEDNRGRSEAFQGDFFAVMGTLNADPFDGEGRKTAIRALFEHPRLRDVRPRSAGGVQSADQGGANRRHTGDPGLDTADWRDEGGPGNLRVDFILPARSLNVTSAGVFWPLATDPLFVLIGADGRTASDHRLVWIDITEGG